MKKIVFLSCDKLDGFITDDHLLKTELEKTGRYEVETHSWSSDVDWKKFDIAIIRTTWDYMPRATEYLAVLKKIESLGVKLLNSSQVVEWNYHKGYLAELESQGVTIVPTHFFTDSPKIPTDWKGDRFIIKPAISASAWKTLIIPRSEIESGEVKKHLHPGDWMLQPFLDEIHQGEISLHFFNNEFSHAIVKIPKSGDFRVQEEHGGDIRPLEISADLKKLGEKIVHSIPHKLLYARVDLVPKNGEYLLMELELIEPALYFKTNAASPRNFLNALDQFLK